MNTHEHLSIEVLADYAEGLLGDADATSVAEQLASCADCQAEADLLVSVTHILAADDPGPMPAHYAARIDAALADLAAAEPVTPKRRETAAGATVIDLASRRRFTPAARVTSVAASLVLLIGGVALGMQALDTSDSGPGGPPVAGEEVTPIETAQPVVERYATTQLPPKEFTKKGKGGAVIDKRDGTTFLNGGKKVLFPDGTVVVHKKSGDAQVSTVNSRGEVSVTTVRAKPTATTAPGVGPTPAPTSEPTPKPTPSPEPTVAPPTPSDPWVKNSGDAYTPDNFAVKIQDLLRSSGDVTFTESSTGDTTAPSPTDQNRVSTGAVRSDESAAPARGPAPAEIEAKVKRCANQLGLTDVLAADAGTWKGQAATIIVTRYASDAKQAVGYVVYGDCTKEAPATKASVQWEQRVELPAAAEEDPAPAPTGTPPVNDTQPGAVTNSPSSSKEQ